MSVVAAVSVNVLPSSASLFPAAPLVASRWHPPSCHCGAGKEGSGRSLSQAEPLTTSFFLNSLQEPWTRQRKRKHGKLFLNQVKHFILTVGYFSGGLLLMHKSRTLLLPSLLFYLLKAFPMESCTALYLCVLHYNYNDNSAKMKAFGGKYSRNTFSAVS